MDSSKTVFASSANRAFIAVAVASSMFFVSCAEYRVAVPEFAVDEEAPATTLESSRDKAPAKSSRQSTAGHDGGFFLKSSDGKYTMNIGGLLQGRFIANVRGKE